jgi:predicted GH43/DUF377 family glycosyl hydrolase
MPFRCHDAPLLTRNDIPDVPPDVVDASAVFNPGACSAQDGSDQHLLLLRVQTRGRQTRLMVARGRPERGFTVAPQLVELAGLERIGARVHHVYDPRITRLEDTLYVVCALDLDRECRIGLFTAAPDLSRLELVAIPGEHDTRNGVLFPARVRGRYTLLERPNRHRNPGGPASGSAIHAARSHDLKTWNYSDRVLRGRWHYWDELIGSGPPPVLTSEGWLHLYHGVATHFAGANVYQVGAVVLDAADPTRVLARTRDNLLEPRAPWEVVGQVPNVVFPGGWVVEPLADDGTASADATVHLYYGAADTCVGHATATVGELLAACHT